MQYTDTGPSGSSRDPETSGVWRSSHWAANEARGMTRPGAVPHVSLTRGGHLLLPSHRRGRLQHWTSRSPTAATAETTKKQLPRQQRQKRQTTAQAATAETTINCPRSNGRNDKETTAQAATAETTNNCPSSNGRHDSQLPRQQRQKRQRNNCLGSNGRNDKLSR